MCQLQKDLRQTHLGYVYTEKKNLQQTDSGLHYGAKKSSVDVPAQAPKSGLGEDQNQGLKADRDKQTTMPSVTVDQPALGVVMVHCYPRV